ncbi:MAG: EAL domain-containing protein, partial [Lachnospiraceae bacterium]|nr:EAL domain-containing protein [Lachnospiraceae bacterium]
NIISEIIYAINTHNMDPANVIIELTESGELESDSRFTKLWSKLKDQGVQLALDDFGTGYSNFHYLNDLKPDIIKIDRSFTMKALQNDYEYNLLALMSGMVHKLNLKVCIEGIEYKEELQKMRQLFPDYCQGYYFGKPMEVEQFRDNFIYS